MHGRSLGGKLTRSTSMACSGGGATTCSTLTAVSSAVMELGCSRRQDHPVLSRDAWESTWVSEDLYFMPILLSKRLFQQLNIVIGCLMLRRAVGRRAGIYERVDMFEVCLWSPKSETLDRVFKTVKCNRLLSHNSDSRRLGPPLYKLSSQYAASDLETEKDASPNSGLRFEQNGSLPRRPLALSGGCIW